MLRKPRINSHPPNGIFYAQGLSLSAIPGLRDISASRHKKANVIFFDAKPASKTAWTKKLWIYDFRTNVHMTLKTKKLVKSDFDEFIQCYKADDRSKRRESRQLLLHCPNSSRPCESKKIDRWKSFTYDELIARDKTNLDIALLSAIHGLHSVSPSLDVIWLKDESIEDTENLPSPDVLAQDIVEQLEAALEEFRSLEEVLTVNGDNE